MALQTIPVNLPLDPRLMRQAEEEELRRRQQMQQDAEERQTMQMLEAMQRANDPRAVALQQNFQRGMEQVTGRDRLRIDPDVIRAGESAPGRLYGGQVQPPKDTRNPFVQGLSRFTRRAMDALADPVANAQIVAALNTMRMQPDPALVKAAQARATGVQERRLEAQRGNQTVQHLRQIGKTQLADMVEADPSLATDALSMAYGMGSVSDKFFAPQTDPVTGEVYVVRVNPNTGQVERVAVPGATQLTEQQKADLRTRETLDVADYTKAQKVGVEAMQTVDQIDSDLRNLEEIITQLDRGAKVGYIYNRLPDLTASSALLNRAANQLGLGVISSTTFGALSESELDFALKTAVPRGLNEGEMRDAVMQIIEGKRALRNDLYNKAYRLSAGDEKYSSYIKSLRVAPENLTEEARSSTAATRSTPTPAGTAKPAPPPGFTQQMWDQYWSAMTEEQRRKF